MKKHVLIDIASQTLSCFEEENCVASYPISSAKAGLGTEAGSYKTPTGHFQIAQKIGRGCPLGTCFVSREPQGIYPLEKLKEQTFLSSEEGKEAQDKILTRILWLDGTEEANANSKARFIYIHGTNQESLVGIPASHGCIRMKNLDIITFFDWAEEKMPLLIV